MILNQVKINSLRNILCEEIALNSKFNFIIGANGSGKTSVLEALYLLSCGHSFKSREVAPIINYDSTSLAVFAKATDESTVAILKSRTGPTQIKLNNQFCSSTSQVAYRLPCQIIYSDVFQILDAGPMVRRSLLDWGLFHVKPNYLNLWKEYKKILKQRNALLKTSSDYSQFVPWDRQLSQLAKALHELREGYFQNLVRVFNQLLVELADFNCAIDYFKGWDKKNSGKELLDILFTSFDSDRQRQFTQYGAHQADILIYSDTHKAKQILSRGQQKIILIALKLAQGQMLEKDCLYLIDDLAAELDSSHQKRLLGYLSGMNGQFVISNIEPVSFINELIDDSRSSCFFMANGSVKTIA